MRRTRELGNQKARLSPWISGPDAYAPSRNDARLDVIRFMESMV